ncbi:MAG: hypothetical protein ACP5NG_00410 [Conexivisphaera sp.]|nr:conserved hypothetical protein [uncultured archaeon]
MSQRRLEDFLAALSREAGARELFAADEDLLVRASALSQELALGELLGGPESGIAAKVAEYGAAAASSLLELRLSKASWQVSERGIAPQSGLLEEGLVIGLLEMAVSRADLLRRALVDGSPLVIHAARWNASREMAVLLMRQDVQAFRGVDLNNYGPFSSGDVAMVPREDARALISKGQAEEVVVLR